MSAMPVRVPAEPRSWQHQLVARQSATLRRLRIVRAPTHPRARVPFVVLCVLVLTGALLGALLLNTSMAHTSFVIQERQVHLARLSERQQDLGQQVERAASPQVLAERARALGMVPAPPPAFVRLSDGTIVGEPAPAGAG